MSSPDVTGLGDVDLALSIAGEVFGEWEHVNVCRDSFVLSDPPGASLMVYDSEGVKWRIADGFPSCVSGVSLTFMTPVWNVRNDKKLVFLAVFDGELLVAG